MGLAADWGRQTARAAGVSLIAPVALLGAAAVIALGGGVLGGLGSLTQIASGPSLPEADVGDLPRSTALGRAQVVSLDLGPAGARHGGGPRRPRHGRFSTFGRCGRRRRPGWRQRRPQPGRTAARLLRWRTAGRRGPRAGRACSDRTRGADARHARTGQPGGRRGRHHAGSRRVATGSGRAHRGKHARLRSRSPAVVLAPQSSRQTSTETSSTGRAIGGSGLAALTRTLSAP